MRYTFPKLEGDFLAVLQASFSHFTSLRIPWEEPTSGGAANLMASLNISGHHEGCAS
jgi:hypothetical protein